MASSGVHSNGFSLVRNVFRMDEDTLNTYHEELGKTLGETLLAPTRIYVNALKSIREAGVTVKACSHITGGGFYENIPRMLIDGKRAVVEKRQLSGTTDFCNACKRRRYYRRNDVQYVQHGTWYDRCR